MFIHVLQLFIPVEISDWWLGEGFYARCLGFPLPKYVLVFSVVCLLFPLFPLHYYIAMLCIV